MPQQLLWLNETAGQTLASGNSGPKRQARIRSHVQSRQGNQAPSFTANKDSAPGEKNLQPPDCVKGVPFSSLQPSRSLGRLASKVTDADATRKRNKTHSGISRQCVPRNAIFRDTRPPLTRSLPFLWHGLASSERGSLAFFQLRTSQEWSGWEDCFFWNILALQVSQQSQAVARSLIAVSALHERIETLDNVERARFQSLSCEQSGKATAAMLARSEVSHFEALVSCLIMVCFHGLQRSQAWFMLLRSGMKLLAECNDPGRVSHEEKRMVDVQIRPLFNRLLSRPCSMVNPCRAFTLSVERHRITAMTLSTEKPLVPQTFNALIEARESLNGILNWAHDNLPDQAGTAMELFLSELHELSCAWQIAMTETQFPKTVQSIRSRKLLEGACLVGTIIINTAYCVEETAYDNYQADFAKILSLVRGAWSTGHSFGIDAGLFDITAFVGSKCRDPHIRRHALRLLKSGDRLEGDRVATNPATILEAVIALEERDLDVTTANDVPELNRLHLICGEQYINQGRLDLFYESADGISRGKCCVSFAGSNKEKASKKFNAGESLPDAIFGTGYAAYLKDCDTKSYFCIDLDRFYFPMPKV